MVIKIMKRLFMLVILGVILTACTSEGEQAEKKLDQNDENGEENDIVGETVISADDTNEFDKIYSDPESYEDYEVEFNGQVFIEPERDSDGTYLQVYADPENHEKNIIVGVEDPDFDVETEDYVAVRGVITGAIEGENLVGGHVKAPTVLAENIEIIDYTDAISPAIETIDVDDSVDQHGFIVHVDKIEIAENMTRVYVDITNNTDDQINFYTFNARLIIDDEQLEEDSNFYDTGLPELDSEILPDVKSEGVIIFPPIEPETESLTFYGEGSSDNFDLDIEPFEFELER